MVKGRREACGHQEAVVAGLDGREIAALAVVSHELMVLGWQDGLSGIPPSIGGTAGMPRSEEKGAT
jgi:hypothetical protein